jgi:hypothetical protein
MILTAIAAAAAITATCNWGDRGLDPFMGDLPSAVDTYTQIPKSVREELKAKMRARKFDDTAHITAAGIRSDTWEYGPLRMMHFGNGSRLCGVVVTSAWPANDPGERALIYTVGEWSIAVPSVCRNVSLITRGARLVPPPGIPPEPVSGGVGPVPVAVPVTIPDVEPGPLADLLPPQTFARLSSPEPLPQDEYPDRISAELTMFDLWQWRPLFGPLPALAFVPAETVAGPVPGVEPPKMPGIPDGGLPVSPIPEPAEWMLMLFGLAWVMWQRRKAA